MSKSILIIGSVFPEPTSSAAGWRMLQLIGLFKNLHYAVHFASASRRGPYTHDLIGEGVQEHEIVLNCSSFDTLLENIHPQIVMFDRFMVEEQYSWRVARTCPQAVRILDTEDLHFLRQARLDGLRSTTGWKDELLFSDLAKREVAAILRCDLSLIISPVEYEILTNRFRIAPELLSYVPLQPNSSYSGNRKRDYADRKDFCFIGNFLHEPNWRTALELKKLWPTIRKKLPDIELHVYGAYTSEKVRQLESVRQGYRVMGRAEHSIETLSAYRVLLAPIPFGAGQKGKFLDAFQAGTPSVTTPVGAEGMSDDHELWPGYITEDQTAFCELSVTLYQNRLLWEEAQKLTGRMVEEFSDQRHSNRFIEQIRDVQNCLQAHRQQNFLGQILWANQFMASKYLALWIEEKNKKKKES